MYCTCVKLYVHVQCVARKGERLAEITSIHDRNDQSDHYAKSVCMHWREWETVLSREDGLDALAWVHNQTRAASSH